VASIWRHSSGEWHLESPAGFPDEAALHTLVEKAPQVLRLSGAPQIVVVGREVRLGNGYADLIAIEPSGRPVVIEVKLAYNGEARRAVVTQILTYAAYLYGLAVEDFEQNVLRPHLQQRDLSDLASAVEEAAQGGSFVRREFYEALAANLSKGRFRLVIVLDDAPPELVELVGFLEAVTDHLTIDLVTVAQYTIADEMIVIPQRVDPARQEERAAQPSTIDETQIVPGADDFIAAIADAPAEQRPLLEKLASWAIDLASQIPDVQLETYHGRSGIKTLLPRFKSEGAGLVTIYKDTRSGYIQFWRSLFVRRAPETLKRLESLLGPDAIRQGNTTRDITDELLDALTAAYREGAHGVIQT
jgi:hypothetical protein